MFEMRDLAAKSELSETREAKRSSSSIPAKSLGGFSQMVATRRSAIAVIDEAAAAEAPAAASAGEAPAASTSAEDTQKTLETQEQLPTHSENTQNVEPATEGMNVAQEVDAVVPPTPQPGNLEPATEGMAEADAVTQEKEITAVIPPTPVPGNSDSATEGMSASASTEAVNGNDPASLASQQSETVANVEPATEGMALSEVPAAVPPTPQPGNTDPATEGMAVEGQTASAEVTAVEPPTPAPGNVEPATEGMQIDSTTAQENGDAAPATNGDASHAAAGDVSMVSEGQTMDPADATAAAPEANGTTPAVKQEQRDVSASQEPPRTKIYIGGLPPRTERADLEDCFGQFGEIDHLELKTGYAFIVSIFHVPHLLFCAYDRMTCHLRYEMRLVREVDLPLLPKSARHTTLGLTMIHLLFHSV